MSQQIGITLGIPVMSAAATTVMGTAAGAGSVLTGVRTAILADVLLALACAGLVAVFHRAEAGRPS